MASTTERRKIEKATRCIASRMEEETRSIPTWRIRSIYSMEDLASQGRGLRKMHCFKALFSGLVVDLAAAIMHCGWIDKEHADRSM